MASSTKQKKLLATLLKEDPELYKTILASKVVPNLSNDIDDSGEESNSDSDDNYDVDDDDDVEDLYADEDRVETKKLKTSKSKPQPTEESSDEEEEQGIEEDDGSEEEGTATAGNGMEITTKLVKEWKQQLLSKHPEKAFSDVSAALLLAVESLDSKESAHRQFKVNSPQAFNELVHLCLLYMAPALRQILRINNLAHMTGARKFRKYSNTIKSYMQNLMKLYDCITDSNLREVTLRQGVLPLLACYKVHSKQCRMFIKKMATVWSTGHTKIRIIAFIAIFRLVKMMDVGVLDYALKAMYLSYVQNSRFTSPTSIGCICFMRLSLTELYSLDLAVAYRHAFVYIRQMAYHLRNAIIANKKEKFQLVYNWQFMHSLNLWVSLLSSTHPSAVLEPLIYPVVQLALGTIKLQQSPKFFPLVLHVCDMLTELSSATGTFIPVLPFLIKVFTEVKPDAKSVKKSKGDIDTKFQDDGSKSGPNWNCILKVAESEVGKGSVMKSLLQESICHITRYLASEAHSIAFPELVVPAVIALKKCEKRKDLFCQSVVRQLLAKISEHSEYIDKRRQDVTFQLKDRKQLQDWETATRQEEDLPIVMFNKKLQGGDDEALHFSKKRKREENDKATIKKKNKRARKAASILSAATDAAASAPQQKGSKKNNKQFFDGLAEENTV